MDPQRKFPIHRKHLVLMVRTLVTICLQRSIDTCPLIACIMNLSLDRSIAASLDGVIPGGVRIWLIKRILTVELIASTMSRKIIRALEGDQF